VSGLGWLLLIGGFIAAAMALGEFVDRLKHDHPAHTVRHSAPRDTAPRTRRLRVDRRSRLRVHLDLPARAPQHRRHGHA
jgi:hypothetical protein